MSQARRRWGYALVALIVVPPLLGLGMWQWSRATEKAAWLATQSHGLADALTPWEQRPARLQSWQRFQVRGHYAPSLQWLLDNRTSQGRVGYEVYSVFRPVSGGVLLIDRGWLAAPASRAQLPELPLPTGEQVLDGYLVAWPQVVTLGDVPLPENTSPPRVQTMNANTVAVAGVARDALPLRLLPDMPGALAVPLPTPTMTPARHQGYAVQWFSLAFAALVLLLWGALRVPREHDDATHASIP